MAAHCAARLIGARRPALGRLGGAARAQLPRQAQGPTRRPARPDRSGLSAPWSSSFAVFTSNRVENALLLDDDFLEQHGVDLARRDRDIDAPGQLFLEPVQPGGAVEIGRRAVRADRSGTHPSPAASSAGSARSSRGPAVRARSSPSDIACGRARARQIDQHIRQVDERRGLDDILLGHFLLGAERAK